MRIYPLVAVSVLAALSVPGLAAEPPAKPSIKAALEALNPEVKVLSVTASPVPGIRAVALGNSEFLYVTENAEYIFTGQLLRREGKAAANLTELSRQRVRQTVLADIDLSRTITFPAGPTTSKAGQKDGAQDTPPTAHEVFVFTDVSCAYCRKFHSDIAAYNAAGITVHYLAYPRAGTDSEAAKAMAVAWCSDTPQELLTEALTSSREDVDRTPPEGCHSPVTAQYQLGRKIGVKGTPSIYDRAGHQLGGYLSVDDMKAYFAGGGPSVGATEEGSGQSG